MVVAVFDTPVQLGVLVLVVLKCCVECGIIVFFTVTAEAVPSRSPFVLVLSTPPSGNSLDDDHIEETDMELANGNTGCEMVHVGRYILRLKP